MAELDTIIRTVITPGLELLPSRMDSVPARVQLLATGLQESRFIYRDQVESSRGDLVDGPAMSFWQMERGGGVTGVMTHPASSALARKVCEERGVKFNAREIWKRLESDDLLGCAFARLLLWTDPPPLPPVPHAQAAWSLYVRTWRPGAVKRDPIGLRAKWERNYALAVDAVRNAPQQAVAP